jgi:hypothetical protein
MDSTFLAALVLVIVAGTCSAVGLECVSLAGSAGLRRSVG